METVRFPGALRSVRVRILLSMLVVTALAMAIAGAASFLVQRERTLAQIDERLAHTVEDLQLVAAGDGTDASIPTSARG